MGEVSLASNSLIPKEKYRLFLSGNGNFTPKRHIFSAFLAGSVGIAAPLPASAQNGDYDLDCGVILCLAGGFPSGCEAPWNYMIDRITDFPKPKPPFGICTGADGKAYRNIDSPYAHLDKYSPSGWYCPAGTQLYHQVQDEDHGQRRVTAFCYTGRSIETTGHGKDREQRSIWHGKSSATPVDFRTQITVEPGASAEYRSPTYLLNSQTGFLVEQGQ